MPLVFPFCVPVAADYPLVKLVPYNVLKIYGFSKAYFFVSVNEEIRKDR
jgi:hypothetical protein